MEQSYSKRMPRAFFEIVGSVSSPDGFACRTVICEVEMNGFQPFARFERGEGPAFHGCNCGNQSYQIAVRAPLLLECSGTFHPTGLTGPDHASGHESALPSRIWFRRPRSVKVLDAAERFDST